jgi:hypothetical protein
VAERGYEGYVAQDEASAYEARQHLPLRRHRAWELHGQRHGHQRGPTRRWLKVKQRDWTVEGDGWQRRVSAAG